jgi:pseudaminic acid cytidylyltransferase
MKIAVIPARGGSKRIPSKNIGPFCGRPMLAYSIEAAIASECFDKIIVSTDDEDIADIALIYGAEVPFMRPENLSDDFTGTAAVIRHAIEWFTQQTIDVSDVCCICATAPFIQAEYIIEAYEKLRQKDCMYVFPITSFAFPIQRAITITEDNTIEMLYPENIATRSQDLTEAFHDAGQFYWGKAQAWINEVQILGKDSLPIILPRYLVQDIDTKEDWETAELMYQAFIKNNRSNMHR